MTKTKLIELLKPFPGDMPLYMECYDNGEGDMRQCVLDSLRISLDSDGHADCITLGLK